MKTQLLQIENLEANTLLAEFRELKTQIKTLSKHTARKTLSERFLSRQDVAKLFGISYPTVQEWSRKGVLKAYKVANRVYFKANEIEQALIAINNPQNLD